jgi:ribosomal protein S18 acetylase RimI-like enzyme
LPESGEEQASLADVRRFEAAGFRAWPASSVEYDGAWLVRLTPALPAKRLNSVNPLDPADTRDIGPRIERLARCFQDAGRPLTFRLSPLAARAIADHLDAAGWSSFGHSLVMQVRLDKLDLGQAIDRIPLKDVRRFVTASLTVSGGDRSRRAGLAAVIGAIEPEAGLFVHELDGRPAASAICVQHRDLAGLFEVATDRAQRRHGHARRLLLSALKWARQRGARRAWLQVEADNQAALALYRALGFTPVYGYHYRRPPEVPGDG